MSFVITFSTVCLVFFIFLGLFEGAKALWKSKPEDDGEVERTRTLRKQVKESLESYHGKYKVRNYGAQILVNTVESYIVRIMISEYH